MGKQLLLQKQPLSEWL